MKIKEILEHYEIPFSAGSRKLFAVWCPFCEKIMGSPGRKANGAIFLDHGNFTCWRCGTNASLQRFIWKAKGVRYEELDGFIRANITDTDATPHQRLDSIFNQRADPTSPVVNPSTLVWPLVGTKPIYEAMSTKAMRRFRHDRNFTVGELIYYRTMFGYAGEMFGRLVIPIMDMHTLKVLSYTGRDLTGLAPEPYRFPPGIPSHQHLYIPPGHSDLRNRVHRVVLVEGCFDAWAVASVSSTMAVALMGKRLYPNHIRSLKKELPEDTKIFVMLDCEAHAQRDAETWAAQLSNHFDHVGIIRTPHPHDPASMPREDLKRLLRSKLCKKPD